MPATRRPRSYSRTRRSREKTTWENVNFEVTNGAGGASTLANISPVLVQTNNYQTPSKIIRMIMSYELVAPFANANPQTLAIGIWVTPHENLDVGALDVINDFQQDFYYWTTEYITPQSTNQLTTRWTADIRTSRRLRGGYGLLFKAQTPVQELALQLNVSMRNLWVLGSG